MSDVTLMAVDLRGSMVKVLKGDGERFPGSDRLASPAAKRCLVNTV
jgi:hypothetical protein